MSLLTEIYQMMIKLITKIPEKLNNQKITITN